MFVQQSADDIPELTVQLALLLSIPQLAVVPSNPALTAATLPPHRCVATVKWILESNTTDTSNMEKTFFIEPVNGNA
jgi:hypothetical protein